MSRASVNEKEGSLDIPLGSNLIICYRNKKTGIESIARMLPGPRDNHFYALFEDDNVDFEVCMKNSLKDRSVCFRLNILNKSYGFVTYPSSNFKIETLDSNGRKLHFIRQSGEEGEDLVSKTATAHGMTCHAASVMLSEIKFSVEYSKPPPYTIYIQAEHFGKISLRAHKSNTLGDLKKMIELRIGLNCSYQIIHFYGKCLEGDNQSLEKLHITEHSILDLKGTILPIEVKVLPNKQVRLEINSLDTVAILKKNMEDEEGIPVNQQCWYFKGKELRDRSFFALKGINDTLFLHTSYGTLNENSENKNLHECISQDSFPVKVNLLNNYFVTVDVCPLETVQELIAKVYEKEVLAGYGNLQCFLNKKRLKNYLPLEVYNVNRGSRLVLLKLCPQCTIEEHLCTSEKGQQIFCNTLTGRIITVPFCGFDEIATIKQKLNDIGGWPTNLQVLKYELELEDELTLNDYNICNGSTLYFILKLRGGGIKNESERGAITFGDTSQQTFSNCYFESDDSVKIEPFVVELRLSAVPLLN